MKKIVNKKTVGVFIILATIAHIYALIHLKNYHHLQCVVDFSNLTTSNIIDCLIVGGFPISLVFISLIALWVAKLKETVEYQQEQTETDRQDLIELFNSMDDFICVLDPKNHNIKFINTAYINKLKLDNENIKSYKDVLGKYCYEVFFNSPETCPLCCNNELFDNGHRIKSHTSEFKMNNIWYKRVSKGIIWKGKEAKFEMVTDINHVKEKFNTYQLTEHRMKCMIDALTDAYVLFEPVETESKEVTGWNRVLFNTAYEVLSKKHGKDPEKDKGCMFTKRTSDRLKKYMLKVFIDGKVIQKHVKHKKVTFSLYIYKANHGVALNLREVK